MSSPMRILFLALTSAVASFSLLAEEQRIPAEKVLALTPSETNPRNSEGDFIALADGTLLFIYTRFSSGADDFDAACLASRRSEDGGATWSTEDEIVLENEGQRNVMSVSLLRLESGEIALFYLRKNGAQDCRPCMRVSRDEGRSWSDAVECIPEPVGYYVVNNSRVIQLRSGRLVIPAAIHALHGAPFKERSTAVCFLSDDAGKNWYRSDSELTAPEQARAGFQEPGIVELPDGTLLMHLRNDLGAFYESRSGDGGTTWSDAVPTTLKTPVSPGTCVLIPGSERLLLLWNDHSQIEEALAGKRTPLTLAVSDDGGRHWHSTRLIEDNPAGWYCYTAARFTKTHLLLGYCAGDTRSMPGLSLTQITCIALTDLAAL